jgi:integrase
MAEKKLTQKRCEKFKARGLYNDGGGLCLKVPADGGAKSWVFRYAVGGRDRYMGLGSFRDFDIEKARERATECRRLRADGIDPIEHRMAERKRKKQEEEEARLAAKKDVTFRDCAEKYIAEQNWRAGSRDQAERYFPKHIYPKVGEVLVRLFDIDHVEAVCKPLLDRPSAASRALSYLNGVLEFAKAHRVFTGDLPTDLSGPLQKAMPRLVAARERATKGAERNPWLDFKRIGEFMTALRRYYYQGPWAGKTPVPARALEFLALTGVRGHMVTGHSGSRRDDTTLKWNQIDWEERLATWTPDQHKVGGETKRDYIVPLSKQAIAVLKEMRTLQEEWGFYGEDKPVFVHPPSVDKNPSRKPSRVEGRPIDKSALGMFLKSAAGKHGWKDKDGNRISPPEGWLAKDKKEKRLISPHGFRSTFGGWAVANADKYPDGDSEIALGHSVGNPTRNRYKDISPRIEPVRVMLQDWANYCDQPFDPVGAADNDVPVLAEYRGRRRAARRRSY